MKYLIFLLALFLLPIAVFSQPSGELKNVEQLIQKGQTIEALVILNSAVRKNPSNGQALRLLGDVYLMQRNFRLATLFLQQAIEKTKVPDENMYFDLAEALHFRHQFEDAIENYKLSDPKGKKRVGISSKIQQCENGIALMGNPLEVKITNLGEKINSMDSELHPLVTADFTQLFYTKITDNSKEVYQSFNKGNWEKAIPLPSPVNTDAGELCAGISADGQVVYIIKPTGNGDIFISEFKDGIWTKPKAFLHNSPKSESSVCLSSDGKKLFFVSDRNGQKDIFSCNKTVKGWAKPIKLGKNINSNQDEESPWMDADGKYLYFSSKGHKNMGGFDIFKVELNNLNAEPENIGFPINSASDDLYYMLLPDEKTAFYSSYRDGGFGNQDIYSIRMSIGKTPLLKLFKGTVSEASGLPLDATVLITETETNQVVARLKSHPETGTFVTMLQANKNYTILVEKEGFLFYSDLINLADGELVDLSRDIKMQKLLPGVTLVLNNIFFDFGKSSLKKESSQELQRILLIMRQNSGLKAEISSHLDDSGIEEFSQKLSENRAQAVVDYLVTTGIKSTRLIAKGYGSTKPIAENTSEQGNLANRRTEFKILSVH